MVGMAVAGASGKRVAAGPSSAASVPFLAVNSPATSEAPSFLPGTAPAPSPVSSPSPGPTLVATPSFAPIDATSCDPGLVPSAVVAPSVTPAVTPPGTSSGTPEPDVAKLVLHVPILMYHRIVPYAQAGDARPGLVVPPQTFAAQLDALERAGWRTITAAQLADDIDRGVAPPPKTFVITIDDGWDDGYTYALPILQAHGDLATYYVIASRINHGSFLKVDQLRALVAAGDEVGDHTMDHVALASQSGSKLAYEIDAAAATIALATGEWPQTLAYPSGSFNTRAEDAVKACSPIKMALIEGEGTYESWDTRFAIPRVKVSGGVKPDALLQWVSNPWLPASMEPKSSPKPTTRPTAQATSGSTGQPTAQATKQAAPQPTPPATPQPMPTE